jgi:hypothetical protein
MSQSKWGGAAEVGKADPPKGKVGAIAAGAAVLAKPRRPPGRVMTREQYAAFWRKRAEQDASVLRKADAYGYGESRRPVSDTAVAALAGGGAAGLGWRELKRAEGVADVNATRLSGLHAQSDASNASLARAQTRLAETQASRASHVAAHPKNWGQASRARRRAARVEAAQLQADRDAASVVRARAAAAPQGVARQQELMRRGGRALVVGGAGLTAAAAGRAAGKARRRRLEMRQPEMIAKTITQSKWGGSAEAGRAWRGPEKKDRNRAADAAVGSAVVGAGGLAAAGVGRRRLAMPDASESARRLDAAAAGKDAAARRAAMVAHSRQRLYREARDLSEAARPTTPAGLAARDQLRRAIRDEGVRFNVARGKVSPEHVPGGSYVGYQQGKWNETRGPAKAAYWDRVQARADAAAEHARVAPDAVERARAGRLVRRGGKVAAAGAVGAVGAGILAERNRKGPKRRRLSQVNAQARAQASEPVAHKPFSERELEAHRNAKPLPFTRGQLSPGVEREKRVY